MKYFKRLFLTLLILGFTSNLFALGTVRLGPSYFPETARGRPVALGSIYVGQPDLDPSILANQKQLSVRQESGTVVTVSQPISTSAGGIPLYLGSPVTLLVDGYYSLKVLDSSGTQVYYVPSSNPDALGAAQDNCYPDYNAVNQGLTGDNDTIKYCVDTYGSDQGTIVLRHNSGSATTTYVLGTDEVIPTNITLQIERGAILSISVGKTLTINGLLEVGMYQCFSGAGTVTFGAESIRFYEPVWEGGTAIASIMSQDNKKVTLGADYFTNLFIGNNAGAANTALSPTEGRQNTFIGSNAGFSNTTGYAIDNFGYTSGYLNTTGVTNVNIGYQSGYNNVTGNGNVNLGTDAGGGNLASDNTFIGFHCGGSVSSPTITGTKNVFIGSEGATVGTSLHQNTSVGYRSGSLMTTGYYNALFGETAGFTLATGYQNSVFGARGGFALTTGYNNVFNGYLSGFAATEGHSNTLAGYASGFRLTTGDQNILIGAEAGQAMTTASTNSYIGYRSGYTNTDGYNNAGLGSLSLFALTTGYNNVGVGGSSGEKITTGNSNTFVGNNAGNNASQKVDAVNSTAIGNAAYTTADNQVVIGSSSVTLVTIPAYGAGTATFDASGNISSVSDQRLKEDAGTFDVGLDEILKLEPRYFFYKDKTKHDDTKQIGFYAQEVAKIVPEAAPYSNDKDVWGIYDNALIAVLVKAVQEQQVMIDDLTARVNTLEQNNKEKK